MGARELHSGRFGNQRGLSMRNNVNAAEAPAGNTNVAAEPASNVSVAAEPASNSNLAMVSKEGVGIEVASTLFARMKGLFGRDSIDGVLMLVPCNDIHTFCMRHPIDVAFVDSGGVVIESHRGVGPNRRLRNRCARATLERFAEEGGWFEPGDRL